MSKSIIVVTLVLGIFSGQASANLPSGGQLLKSLKNYEQIERTLKGNLELYYYIKGFVSGIQLEPN